MRVCDAYVTATVTVWLHVLGQSIRSVWRSSPLDTAAVQHALEYANHSVRASMKSYLKQPLFIPRYNISIREEREMALARLKGVCQQKFFSVKDFKT